MKRAVRSLAAAAALAILPLGGAAVITPSAAVAQEAVAPGATSGPGNSGTLTTAEGTGIQNATITGYDGVGNAVGTAVTALGGGWSIADPAVVRWALTSELADGLMIDQRGLIVLASVITVELEGGAGVLASSRGAILVANGNVARVGDCAGCGSHQGKIKVQRGTTTRIYILYPGKLPMTFTGTTPRTVNLGAQGRDTLYVRGSVRDRQGAPIAGAIVNIRHELPFASPNCKGQATNPPTGEDGEYVIAISTSACRTSDVRLSVSATDAHGAEIASYAPSTVRSTHTVAYLDLAEGDSPTAASTVGTRLNFVGDLAGSVEGVRLHIAGPGLAGAAPVAEAGAVAAPTKVAPAGSFYSAVWYSALAGHDPLPQSFAFATQSLSDPAVTVSASHFPRLVWGVFSDRTTGKMIEGVEVEVTGPNGAVVDTLVSNADGLYWGNYPPIDGEYTTTVTATPPGYGVDPETGDVVRDVTAPVVTAAPAHWNLLAGLDYNPLVGVSAQDDVDGSVAPALDGPAPAEIGEHTLTYRATDRAGNQGTAARTVEIADPSLVISSVEVPGTAAAGAEVDYVFVVTNDSIFDVVLDSPGCEDAALPAGASTTCRGSAEAVATR